MKTLLLLLLRFYKYAISPMLGQNCRFYPNCSEYAAEAIRLHGAARGSYLAGRRVCKCHPWHPGGVDHVPPVAEKTETVPTSGKCHHEHSGDAGHSSHLS
ncbi:membrane protein insertion efficiency factor YidD [Undibacterium oligocarboniphilum]|uniref:Putative membrane protein insertion efficiency factor n=1 Tax=Undibacterium oligocarboniphilum TaxID=666702 RepID=A0A850QM98_9BURK|nr:membrane protein insertion efficiency factor YidD [Undibacterium oligocarboniphilum]MBC3869471.1 membrane protein insertion efficiency factor YidD [Undibacterium oligocarboniphilum]NVO77850.1 membrane protein insertion efficiency factor YidD [Undibacterium oligocarboniphilum]